MLLLITTLGYLWLAGDVLGQSAKNASACLSMANCAGPMSLQCGPDQRVFVTRMLFGSKPSGGACFTASSCSSCCQPDNNDCFAEYTDKDFRSLYNDCWDKQNCTHQVNRTSTVCVGGAGGITFSVAEYVCLESGHVTQFHVNTTVTAPAVAIHYNAYNVTNYPVATGDNKTWHCQVDTADCVQRQVDVTLVKENYTSSTSTRCSSLEWREGSFMHCDNEFRYKRFRATTPFHVSLKVDSSYRLPSLWAVIRAQNGGNLVLTCRYATGVTERKHMCPGTPTAASMLASVSLSASVSSKSSTSGTNQTTGAASTSTATSTPATTFTLKTITTPTTTIAPTTTSTPTTTTTTTTTTTPTTTTFTTTTPTSTTTLTSTTSPTSLVVTAAGANVPTSETGASAPTTTSKATHGSSAETKHRGDKEKGQGPNTGALVGGVLAAVLVLVAIVLAIVCVVRRSKGKREGTSKSANQKSSAYFTLTSVNSSTLGRSTELETKSEEAQGQGQSEPSIHLYSTVHKNNQNNNDKKQFALEDEDSVDFDGSEGGYSSPNGRVIDPSIHGNPRSPVEDPDYDRLGGKKPQSSSSNPAAIYGRLGEVGGRGKDTDYSYDHLGRGRQTAPDVINSDYDTAGRCMTSEGDYSVADFHKRKQQVITGSDYDVAGFVTSSETVHSDITSGPSNHVRVGGDVYAVVKPKPTLTSPGNADL